MMSLTRRLVLASMAIGLAAASAGRAEAGPVTFDVSGTFGDGSVLGGTLTIDTTSGVATSADVTLARAGASTLTFTNVAYQGFFASRDSYPVQLDEVTPNGTTMLVLGLLATNGPSQSPSIIGYAGGPLASESNLIDGLATTYYPAGGGSPDFLSIGQLSPAPEPPSLALCGIAGALGLGIARVRRSRA